MISMVSFYNMHHLYGKNINVSIPIGSMYGIYANIWGILMVNVTIYSIHGSYGILYPWFPSFFLGQNHLMPATVTSQDPVDCMDPKPLGQVRCEIRVATTMVCIT